MAHARRSDIEIILLRFRSTLVQDLIYIYVCYIFRRQRVGAS